MVHARVPGVYVHFALMYTTDHIFPVIPIKYLINEDGFDAYSKIPKLYGMENIITAEVMDKLDMFQSRFGKINQFGWWDLERISSEAAKEKKIALDLIHQRLGHRSTRSLISGDTDNFWEDVELGIDPDPFCTS